MRTLEIRLLPIDSLIPAEYNPRTVTAKAFRKLKLSLEKFGLVEPLVWNERTGHVVGGHQRLRALRELGFAEVPVSVVCLGDAEEKALNVMLNNLEVQGRYDPAKLLKVLHELAPLERVAAGFDDSTLRLLELMPEVDAFEPETGDGAIEVTLKASPATYEAMQGRLDGLIRDFDLISHVRYSPASASVPRCNATTASASSLP